MNIFKSRKTELLQDMSAIKKYLTYAVEAHEKYAKSWSEMGETIEKMIVSQNPAVAELMSKFSNLLGEIGKCHERLAKEELRNSEDFNDIIERYNVLYRAFNTHNSAKDAYKNADANLKSAYQRDENEKAKPDYESHRKVKLQNDIEKYRSQKSEALKVLKEALRDLIDQRTKYNNFKVRRLIEGWNRYGHALKVESQAELDLIVQVQDVLAEIKGVKAVSQSDLNAVEQAITQHIENAPAPAYEPTQETLADANEVTTPAEAKEEAQGETFY